jgi:hypothetical protein
MGGIGSGDKRTMFMDEHNHDGDPSYYRYVKGCRHDACYQAMVDRRLARKSDANPRMYYIDPDVPSTTDARPSRFAAEVELAEDVLSPEPEIAPEAVPSEPSEPTEPEPLAIETGMAQAIRAAEERLMKEAASRVSGGGPVPTGQPNLGPMPMSPAFALWQQQPRHAAPAPPPPTRGKKPNRNKWW